MGVIYHVLMRSFMRPQTHPPIAGAHRWPRQGRSLSGRLRAFGRPVLDALIRLAPLATLAFCLLVWKLIFQILF